MGIAFEIIGSHSGDYEDHRLLGYDTVQFVGNLQLFPTIPTPYSR
jgi:hypothetical protein